MTFTPAATAFASIAAPLPGSSGSTSRTEAPALMSASACVCMVEALPLALSILKLAAERPAASKACFRYGASYWTYRVDVVVSGRSTPIMPLPCEAKPVSCFMSAKSAVKSAALICGTAAAVVDDLVEEGVVDELHAEDTSPKESTAHVSAKDFRPVPIDFPSVDNAIPYGACSQGNIIALYPPSHGIVLLNRDE